MNPYRTDAVEEWLFAKDVRPEVVPVPNANVSCVIRSHSITSAVQAQPMSLFGHIARMDNNADAKRKLAAPPLEEWRQHGHPRSHD